MFPHDCGTPHARRVAAQRPFAVLIKRFRRPPVQRQANDLGSTPVHSVRDQPHRAACQRLVLQAHYDPHLAQAGEADGQRAGPVGVLADVNGPLRWRRDQWHQRRNRDVGPRQLHRPAVGIAPVKAGRFQPAILFEQTDPVVRPPGQAPTKSAASYQASNTTTPNGTWRPRASSTRSMARAIVVRNGSCRARHSGSWSHTGSTC